MGMVKREARAVIERGPVAVNQISRKYKEYLVLLIDSILNEYYIQELESLFSSPLNRKKQSLSRPFPELEECATRRELELGVMGELWRVQEKDLALMELSKALLENKCSYERFERAFYHVETELTDPEILDLDIFKPYSTSASRLEEYSKCPFKYYAQSSQTMMNLVKKFLIPHCCLILNYTAVLLG